MKKTGLITMFFLVGLMVAPVFAADTYIYLGQGLDPAAVTATRPVTIFVNPYAKGFGDANKPNAFYLGQGLNPAAVTPTHPGSIFVNPYAKGFGEPHKPVGIYLGQGLNPAVVTPLRINMFTGKPY